jgi:hypothetical protein
MFDAGGPLEATVGRKTYDLTQGEIRSAYEEAPATLLKMGNDLTLSDTARVYPLYLWAKTSSDWELLTTRWPAMKRLMQTASQKNEPDLGNGRISGLIAACRLARHFKDDSAVKMLLPPARQALRDRLIYEFAHTEGGLITTAGNRTIFGRWENLNPDLGAILAAFTSDIHRHLMDIYVDHHRPAWFVAWNVELLWRNEAPFSFPNMSSDIFAARALILHEPAERLAKYVDLPWCKGDEFYIQKLALLARR